MNDDQNKTKQYKKLSFFKRRLLVNKRFQLTFILFLFSISASIASIDMFFFQLYERRILQMTESLSAENAALVGTIIQPMQSSYVDLVLYTVSATLLISAVFGLLISHRVAGPIYRMLQIFGQLIEGKKVSTPIRLRNGDFFPELQQALTALVDYIQNEKKPSKSEKEP